MKNSKSVHAYNPMISFASRICPSLVCISFLFTTVLMYSIHMKIVPGLAHLTSILNLSLDPVIGQKQRPVSTPVGSIHQLDVNVARRVLLFLILSWIRTQTEFHLYQTTPFYSPIKVYHKLSRYGPNQPG